MRSVARRGHRRAEWRERSAGIAAVGVWTERHDDRGEDAEPLFAHDRTSGRGIVGVFDGVGDPAAGPDGARRTAAWAGSRLARSTTDRWFRDSVERRAPADARRLGAALGARLAAVTAPAAWAARLSTTLACVEYRVGAVGAVDAAGAAGAAGAVGAAGAESRPGGRRGPAVAWTALWAGDSRCYLLDDRRGLQQVSADDATEGDALARLAGGSRPTNTVSAAAPFHVRHVTGVAVAPVVLLCATDGFFDHVETPADFEHVLLGSLVDAADQASWTERLGDAVSAYTTADASLALVALGYGEFAELRDRFAARAATLAREHWRPMRAAEAHGPAAFAAAKVESWRWYRGAYQRLVPVAPHRARPPDRDDGDDR